MRIEFFTHQHLVKEWVLNHVKEKLLEFHKLDNEISEAQVFFREEEEIGTPKKICEISLDIFGDNLFVHRKSDSFEQASMEVLDELTQKVDELVKKQRDPPDETTSTVKV